MIVSQFLVFKMQRDFYRSAENLPLCQRIKTEKNKKYAQQIFLLHKITFAYFLADFFQLFYTHLEERTFHNVYEQLKKNEDYQEAL